MTIEEAKALLPTELKYPLPDRTIDNLIIVQSIPLKFNFGDDDWMYAEMMAALIELKERREQSDR